MSDFKVGDLVEIIPNHTYNITTGGQQGVIRELFNEGSEYAYAYITFDLTTHHWTNEKEYTKTASKDWDIRTKYLKLLEPEEAGPRSLVERKIRKLWNQSNWVKLDPKRAY